MCFLPRKIISFCRKNRVWRKYLKFIRGDPCNLSWRLLQPVKNYKSQTFLVEFHRLQVAYFKKSARITGNSKEKLKISCSRLTRPEKFGWSLGQQIYPPLVLRLKTHFIWSYLIIWTLKIYFLLFFSCQVKLMISFLVHLFILTQSCFQLISFQKGDLILIINMNIDLPLKANAIILIYSHCSEKFCR